jgi:hypothetical protein
MEQAEERDNKRLEKTRLEKEYDITCARSVLHTYCAGNSNRRS